MKVEKANNNAQLNIFFLSVGGVPSAWSVREATVPTNVNLIWAAGVGGRGATACAIRLNL